MNSLSARLEGLDRVQIRRWSRRGGLAILDQGLFSGANFLVNIFLARWLAPDEYGAFAVSLSLFYMLAGVHTAVLTEPMVVFGAGKYREQFRKYFGMVLWGHWGVSGLIALGLGAATWIFFRLGSLRMAEALAGLAIASPFLLSLWIARRACYAQFRPAWAAVASGICILIVVAGLFLLWRRQRLSALNGFLLLGAAAGLASLVLVARQKPQVAGYEGNPTPSSALADHWRYGRWNIPGFWLYWASGQMLMLLIPIFLGLAASAAVAAVWTLYRPIGQVMQALGSLVLPAFSRMAVGPGGRSRLKRRAMGIAALFAGVVALYALIVGVFAEPILHFLYRGKYDNHTMLVALFGMVMVSSMLVGVFVSALKAIGRVKETTRVWLISTLATSMLAFPFMRTWGANGALLAFAGSYLLASLLAYKYLRRIG